MKNKRKEKSFGQGPIMLGITIGLGIFVCTAAALIALSFFGIIGGDVLGDVPFTAPSISYEVNLTDSMKAGEGIP